MSGLGSLAERARAAGGRLVLVARSPQPEVITRLDALGLGTVTLVGDGGVTPATDPRLSAVAARLRARWPERVRDDIHALDLAAEPLLFAAGLVIAGEADVLLADAGHRVDAVEDAYRWILGPERATRGRGAVRYVATRDGRLLSTVTPDTAGRLDARGLAQLALAAANHRQQAVGDPPKVGFLVPPPTVDASHADAELALTEFTALAPGFPASVDWGALPGAAPGSPQFRSRPNVLIFPDPVSGHLAHALVRDTTATHVWGPIFPGERWVVAGVEDGAAPDDLVAVATVAAAGIRRA